MADSFFSSFTAACRFEKKKSVHVATSDHEHVASKSRGFNHKERLMKQAADSYAYSKQCEVNLHRREEHYTRRCKHFMHQIAKLKLLNKELSTALQLKDKLLREKSHDLIRKTTEIINLKEEVQELKLQLLLKHNGLTTFTRNASSHSNLTVITQETSLSASDDELPPQRQEASQEAREQHTSSAASPLSSACINKQFVPRTKLDLPTESLPNIEPDLVAESSKETEEDKHTANVSRCNYDGMLAKYLLAANHSDSDLQQLPFIHRKTSTQTSSLSACAVKISFPSPTMQVQVAMPNESNMLGPTPLQLSPISESKPRDEFQKKASSSSSSSSPPPAPDTPNSPFPLLKTSDDNKDIDEEWGQSIAGEDTHTLKTEETERSPVPKDARNEEEEEEMSPIQNALEFVKEFEQSDDMLDDNVSYCTDNTYDMMEMMMDDPADNDMLGCSLDVPVNDTKRNNVSKVSSGHFSKQSHGHISRSDIDGVIRAPINIFGFNSSFFQFQFQLQGPVSSHNRENAAVNVVEQNVAD